MNFKFIHIWYIAIYLSQLDESYGKFSYTSNFEIEQVGFLPCQTLTSTVRLKVERGRVNNGLCRIRVMCFWILSIWYSIVGNNCLPLYFMNLFSSYQLHIFYSGLIYSVVIVLCLREPHAHEWRWGSFFFLYICLLTRAWH